MLKFNDVEYLSSVEKLPFEIWLTILQHLSVEEAIYINIVSKAFFTYTKYPAFWQRLFNRNFSFIGDQQLELKYFSELKNQFKNDPRNLFVQTYKYQEFLRTLE